MRKIGLWIVVAVAAAGTWARAGELLKEAPAAVGGKENGVGRLVPDLAFTDVDGKPGKLSDFKSSKLLVVTMTSASCPVARKYGPRLAELEQAYRGKGVAFVAVNASAGDSAEKAKEAAAQFRTAGWAGRYVADPEGVVAGPLRATTTTEVFVLDAARTLVYRGAIDDQYGLGYALDAPKRRYLVNALDALLNGDRPEVTATTAPGCLLSLKQPAAAAEPAVTYHNQIARIVQSRCVECHREGENGPFELTSFADVKANAAMIKKVVGKRTMPPWFATPTEHAFKNDRSLSEREIADITKWVDAGCPEGDAADAPLPPKFVDGWRIGKPDLVLESPSTQTIPAQGTIRYRYVVVPTNLTEDKWVTAMEVRPSAPEVVHHLLVFVSFPRDNQRSRQALALFDGGLNGYFAGMVPGQGDITFPTGTAKRLPKGSSLVFQIHYTANGKETKDRPRIGFKFADKAPEFEVHTRAASNRFFAIPPGAPNHEVTSQYTFQNPTRLLSVNPHSHVRGKAFKYELIYPDGKTETILDLPRYHFNWQIEHQFAKPIDVPAGTRVKVTGWYDNSKDNPANPDPTKLVRFGEQTWQEMMIGYFTGHVLKPAE